MTSIFDTLLEIEEQLQGAISNENFFDKFIDKNEHVPSTNTSETSPSQDLLLRDIDSVNERLFQHATVTKPNSSS
eukprot:IDg13272t1